jgi:hypothetical protein
MRLMHGYRIAILMALLLSAAPAFAAPQRIVSTFLCTDEYVFRLVSRQRIAALSFLAADTHPVVSTIRDKVAGIPLTRGSATTDSTGIVRILVCRICVAMSARPATRRISSDTPPELA